MLIYLLYMAMPVFVWLLLSLIYKGPINSSDALRKKYLIVCGILIFLMLACRHYSTGSGDVEWYYSNWEVMGGVSFKELLKVLRSFDMENGYLSCIWLLTRVFRHPQFLFIFYGFLVSISVCRFIYINCEDAVIGLTMFHCLGIWGFMAQGVRQGIAMCICLFAIEFCKKKKPIPFFALVIVAMLFHASAIVFAVAYVFSFIKMNVKGYLIVIAGLVGVRFLIDNLFTLVNIAMNDTYAIGSTEDTSGGIVSALIYLLIIVFSVAFHREYAEDTSSPFAFFFYMTLCGFVTFMMRYDLNTIAQRASYYFMFGQIAVLPLLVNRVFKYRQRMLVSSVIVALCLGIAMYKSTYTTLVPYLFFWQG